MNQPAVTCGYVGQTAVITDGILSIRRGNVRIALNGGKKHPAHPAISGHCIKTGITVAIHLFWKMRVNSKLQADWDFIG
jgi:hypothetical protein